MVVHSADDAFIPSESYSGTRSGYIFKRGASGVGYYRDTGASVAVHAAVTRGSFSHKGIVVNIDVPGIDVPQRVWAAGVAVATALCDRHLPSVDGKRVVELGSGMGLNAAVMMHLGASVVATDLPEAISMLSQNLSANASGARGKAIALPCSWGVPVPTALLIEPVDIVVGADIAYVHAMLSPLLATVIELMMTRDNTTLVLAQSDNRGICTQELVTAFGDHICFEEPHYISDALDDKVHMFVGRLRSRERSQSWLREWFEAQAAERSLMFDTHDQMYQATLGTSFDSEHSVGLAQRELLEAQSRVEGK